MYKIESYKENLFVIFGTRSIILSLIVPSDRVLPLRGLEWSFMNITGSNTIGSIEMTKKSEDTDNLL